MIVKLFLILFSFSLHAEISQEQKDFITKEWQTFRDENRKLRKEHYRKIYEKRTEIAKKEYDDKNRFENEIEDLEEKIIAGNQLTNKSILADIKAKKMTHEEFFTNLRKSEIDELKALSKSFEETMSKR